jgi:hypothetical protein
VTACDSGSELVMKGSSVRVRASACKSPAKRPLVLTGQNTSEVLQTGLTCRSWRSSLIFGWSRDGLGWVHERSTASTSTQDEIDTHCSATRASLQGPPSRSAGSRSVIRRRCSIRRATTSIGRCVDRVSLRAPQRDLSFWDLRAGAGSCGRPRSYVRTGREWGREALEGGRCLVTVSR